MEKIKQFFDKNKTVKIVYTTSDGQVFTNENFAYNHSRSLDNKEVVKYEAGEVKSENEKVKNDTPEGENGNPQIAQKETESPSPEPPSTEVGNSTLPENEEGKGGGNKLEGGNSNTTETAASKIEKIKVAATVEEAKAIVGNDKRVTVIAAAEARIQELKNL